MDLNVIHKILYFICWLGPSQAVFIGNDYDALSRFLSGRNDRWSFFSMKIKVGMVGVGAFAQSFIPLFKAHPLVGEIVLCDLDADKLKANAEKHGVKRTSPFLDALCKTDVDAVAIITQHWLHAPQAIQALKAGKHVYSAVPSAVTLDEMKKLVRAVAKTRKIHMVGETSYYYPDAIYCRDRCANGDFGHVFTFQKSIPWNGCQKNSWGFRMGTAAPTSFWWTIL